MIIDNLIYEGTKILRQENIENPMLDDRTFINPHYKKREGIFNNLWQRKN